LENRIQIDESLVRVDKMLTALIRSKRREDVRAMGKAEEMKLFIQDIVSSYCAKDHPIFFQFKGKAVVHCYRSFPTVFCSLNFFRSYGRMKHVVDE
jgi:hypothetical protein